MKTLKLSVLERFMLPQLLPQSGGKIEMLLIGSILKNIEFTATEISDFGLKDEDGNVTWENGRDTEFEFTPEQVEVLKLASKRADEEKKITRQNLPLIKKIDSL